MSPPHAGLFAIVRGGCRSRGEAASRLYFSPRSRNPRRSPDVSLERVSWMASDEAETQEVREAREAQEAAEEDLRIFETLCISSPLKVVNRWQRTSPPFHTCDHIGHAARIMHSRKSTRTHAVAYTRKRIAVARACDKSHT